MQLSMLTNQRWRLGRDSYRPAGEPIDPSHYGVEPVTEATAKAFVEQHHYSGSYPAARCRVGLFRSDPVVARYSRPELVGVAVFSVPCNPRSVPKWTGQDDPNSGVELGRFVLLDDVEGNGETWFLARAFSVLRDEKPDVRAVVSYSDPMERVSRSGRVVKPGHVGTIYQAHNARYVGRGKRETLLLTDDGRIVNRRSLSKVRNQERGAGYAERQLVSLGAPVRRAGQDPRRWVESVSERFRRVRHPGNHVYAWGLDKRAKRLLHDAMSYPKLSN